MSSRWPGLVACACLAGLCPVEPARADDPVGGLERCARVTPADARLQCYDGLARQWATRLPGTEVARAASPSQPVVKDGLAQPAAPGDGGTHDADSRDARSDDAGRFGFSAARAHEPPPGPNEIHARVVSLVHDRGGRVSLVLDNGQTWTYGEDDGRLDRGDSVTIRRAALGSFLMITPDRRTYHVTRTR